MGLASGSDVASLRNEIIYSNRVTLENLYTHLAVAILKDNSRLDILSSAGLESSSTERTLPSWVPDWRQCTMPNSLQHYETPEIFKFQNNIGFCASGSSQSSPEFSGGGKVLGIDGHIVDRITQVGKLCDKMSELNMGGEAPREKLSPSEEIAKTIALLAVFKDWEEIAKATKNSRYPTGEGWLDVYWRTLAGGNMYPGEDELRRAFVRWWNMGNKLWWTLNGIKKTSSISDALGEPADSPLRIFDPDVGERGDGRIQFHEVAAVVYQRRLFKTEKGYIGLGGGVIEVGDSVGIFKGGKLPLLVRPSGKNDKWLLVGVSYVHGIMNGEMFIEEECRRFWFE